jgi:threonine/homoserine/homoserine lactone efflux protein
MIDAELTTYLGFATIFAATPGQSTAVVIQQTVDHGWRAGIATASGCLLANVVHATTAGIGLAVLVDRLPEALAVIRLAGASYLAWLGGRSLWRALRPQPISPAEARAAGRVALGQGFLTNLLNPSIPTFYLVAVPTFVPPAHPLSGYVLLAAIHVVVAFGCHNAWSALFNQLGQLMRSLRARRIFDTVAGVALLWLGARIVRPPI